jgi:hypothetical protein
MMTMVMNDGNFPQVRRVRGVSYLDIPAIYSRPSRDIGDWASRLKEGRLFKDQLIHVILCDGQLSGMRLAEGDCFASMTILPRESEDGTWVPTARLNGMDDVMSYANRSDFSFATRNLREHYIGETGLLCQVVLEGEFICAT